MKAIGFKQSLPIEHENSFELFECEIPIPKDYELLVKVQAISINPIDYKIRQSSVVDTVLDTPKIIGWDAVGTVEAIGEKVTRFQKGDAVFYAGELMKSGCNVEYQLVDERLVGIKPKNLSIAESAAIPLTGVTAYEALFDRMRINSEKDRDKSLLILGGAGGMGSITIQLAKKILGLEVIATASRSETQAWCRKMGADHVVDHYNLKEELYHLGFEEVDYIMDFANLGEYWQLMSELIKPQGHILTITGSDKPLDLNILKTKSVSFSWEYMYTRSLFSTDDMLRQAEILDILSGLLDEGTLVSTLHMTYEGFTVQNMKKAHSLQESGKAIGKTVILF